MFHAQVEMHVICKFVQTCKPIKSLLKTVPSAAWYGLIKEEHLDKNVDE